MALPKRRLCSARSGKRRSHLSLHPVKPTLCSHCKQPKAAHRVCKNCGYYAGVEVITPVE